MLEALHGYSTFSKSCRCCPRWIRKGTSRYSRPWGYRRHPQGPAVSSPAPADIQTLFPELGLDVNHLTMDKAASGDGRRPVDDGLVYRRRESDSRQSLSESNGESNQGHWGKDNRELNVIYSQLYAKHPLFLADFNHLPPF